MNNINNKNNSLNYKINRTTKLIKIIICNNKNNN